MLCERANPARVRRLPRESHPDCPVHVSRRSGPRRTRRQRRLRRVRRWRRRTCGTFACAHGRNLDGVTAKFPPCYTVRTVLNFRRKSTRRHARAPLRSRTQTSTLRWSTRPGRHRLTTSYSLTRQFRTRHVKCCAHILSRLLTCRWILNLGHYRIAHIISECTVTIPSWWAVP